MDFPVLTPQEAAEHINDGYNVGLSGFTASGVPKAVPAAVAERAKEAHAKGDPFKINLFTGASTTPAVDGALSDAQAINKRAPYQSTPDLRKHINAREVNYFDMHLSKMAQRLRYGFYGPIDVAIIEAQSLTPEGDVVLGTGLGIAPTVAMMAKKVIVEINDKLSPMLRGCHDVYLPLDPPQRHEIPVYAPSDRIGTPLLHIDPKKIVGIVHTSGMDHAHSFTDPDETSTKIANNICDFLAGELQHGRIPKEFLPIQSGVGNVANAVLHGLIERHDIPSFEMYTEVVQDSVVKLLENGKCRFASTCSLSLSDPTMEYLFANMEFFHDKLLIRPSEISNSPEVVRRIGVIGMNTALEADIFGNVNSTHVTGTRMMNGIGGSGDFSRNAYLSIFSCPSVTKGGAISNIVPMVSHCDHPEHDVDIIITDQGIADIRGLAPAQRAEVVIENCAHPDYRPLLRDYLKLGINGHTPQSMKNALAFHNAFIETGDMRNVKFA